jgi:adenosylhomocysteinase
MQYHIKDIKLADQGLARIEWAYSEMPVLRQLLARFEKSKPLQGISVSACLHVTTETANLIRVLKAAGVDIVLCASNPLSTQDDVAAALVKHFNIPVYAICGENNDVYYQHIQMALAHQPLLTLDDGADLVSELHKQQPERLKDMIGGTEETTTGVIRLRAMGEEGALGFPVMAVNDAKTKHFFDNRYGTGQSALDGVIRATNRLIAGSVFTVVGYGWCGRGLAMRAKGHGACVIICEVDPVCALEAAMDGYQVMSLNKAVQQTDFIVTVTGNKHVLDQSHFEIMKDGCVVANAGHFNVEINLAALESIAIRQNNPRQYVKEFTLPDGRNIRLLANGRLVNLVAAEGHPAMVMDMSFANQVLALVYLTEQRGKLASGVHNIPDELDHQIALLKLNSMHIQIDDLTDEQRQYLHSWREGT